MWRNEKLLNYYFLFSKTSLTTNLSEVSWFSVIWAHFPDFQFSLWPELKVSFPSVFARKWTFEILTSSWQNRKMSQVQHSLYDLVFCSLILSSNLTHAPLQRPCSRFHTQPGGHIQGGKEEVVRLHGLVSVLTLIKALFKFFFFLFLYRMRQRDRTQTGVQKKKRRKKTKCRKHKRQWCVSVSLKAALVWTSADIADRQNLPEDPAFGSRSSALPTSSRPPTDPPDPWPSLSGHVGPADGAPR